MIINKYYEDFINEINKLPPPPPPPTSKLKLSGLLALLLAASVTLTACGGGGASGGGGDAVSGGETPPGVKVIPVVTLALPSVKVISDDGGNRGEVNEEFLTASDTPAARMQIQATANNAPEPGSVLQRSSNPPRENMFNGERETTQFRKADSDIFSHVGLKNEDGSGTSYVDYFTDYDFAADGDDSDYLVGGIALWVPKDSAITPWIGAAASGNDPFGNASGMGIAAVTGSATYRGKAHGIASVDNVGIENDDTIAITFDADVALTAEFGDDSTGGMISGTVSDFEFSGKHNCEDCDDAIILKAAPIGDINSGFFTGSTDYVQYSVHYDDTIEIDTIENVGKWGGQFYGNGEEQPGSVAGTFGVTHGGSQPDDSTVSFLGVFGAYKSDETPVPGSGGGVTSVNNELLTALATPAALTEMQTAANNNPLYGSVSQLSYGTRTFEVIPFIDDGELSYKTERKRINQDTGAVFEHTRYYDLKFYPDYRGSDTVSTTRFAKDGAFRHVGLKYEYVDEQGNGESSSTAYIDVFTDYDLTEAGGDTDYLVGGIWLWAPGSEASGASTWIGVSASGNDPFGDSSGMGIAAVTGSATYRGKAHGIVSSDNVSDSDNGMVAIAFDADVALTAEFGDDSTGGMISGTVSDFESSDAERPFIGGHYMALKATPIGGSDNGFFAGSTDQVSVNEDGTITEIDENVGKWGGQFYGNGEEQPGSVAGTFGATFGGDVLGDSTFSLLGIFGAHKDDE